MPQDNSVKLHGLAHQITAFRQEQTSFISALRLGMGRVHGKSTLWPILAAHGHELQRRVNDEQGSTEYYENLRVIWAMLAIHTERHLSRLDAKALIGRKPTKDERRATRFLIAAIDDITAGLDDLASRHRKTSSQAYAQKIARLFPDLSEEQIEQNIRAIRRFFGTANHEEHPHAV